MCAFQKLRTLRIANAKMNVSEHSVLTMDSLLLDSSDDDSVQSLEYDGFDCSHGDADNYFEVNSLDARDNGNDQEELKEDYSFACEKGTAYPRITQHNRSALDEQNKHKPHKQNHQRHHFSMALGRQQHFHYRRRGNPPHSNSKTQFRPHRPPFAVTAIYLVTQFNVSLYLSESIHLTVYQWSLMNCAVATFLYTAKQYRKVMSQMQVQSFFSLTLAEIVTAVTMVLLILQLRSAALVVLVGGLIYMALATGIASVYLLTIGNMDVDCNDDEDVDDDEHLKPLSQHHSLPLYQQPRPRQESFRVPLQIIL